MQQEIRNPDIFPTIRGIRDSDDKPSFHTRSQKNNELTQRKIQLKHNNQKIIEELLKKTKP